MYFMLLWVFQKSGSDKASAVYSKIYVRSFPVAQLVEHGASNAKIMGSIPRESKSW